MANGKQPSLYHIVVEKYKQGAVRIGVNKGYSLATYAKVSRNPLVKLFHSFVKIYSYPFVIVGVIVTLLLLQQIELRYYFILLYLIGVFFFIYLESYIQEKVAIASALKNKEMFDELNRRRVIKIIETPVKK